MSENTIFLWTNRPETAYARLQNRAGHWHVEWGYRDPPGRDTYLAQGELKLTPGQLDDVLIGGAAWAVRRGYGEAADLPYVEEHGTMAGALPKNVSALAKKRQLGEMGTLGSGNHYFEVQVVERIDDGAAAEAFGLAAGQIVVSIHIGGSMGTGSYVLAGTDESEARAWSSASHGAGRAMSRHAALKLWQGRELIDQLARQGILIRTRSLRGAAEEAPGAYKDVDLAEATEKVGLARRVAFLRPKVCGKG